MNEFFGKKVFIMGDGISGKGAKLALKEVGAAICEKLTSYLDYIIVSPGVPIDHEIFDFAFRSKISVIGELELGYRLCHSPIIAVTGTNGKTTVTSLIGDILRAGGYKPLVCGNIGVSFAEGAVCEEYDIVALEVSSFQLQTISRFRPDIAVITNLSPDHLDRHKTLTDYFEAKKRISLRQNESDYLVLPSDLIYPSISRIVTFGEESDCFIDDGEIKLFDKTLLKIDDIRLKGKHNIYNVMAAATACSLAGVDSEAIRSAVSNFAPPKHRVEFVRNICGVNFFDDSKGTNIGAVISAAECMDGSVCLLLCGNDKGYEFDELFRKLPRSVIAIVAFGGIKDKILSAAKRCSFGGKIMVADGMADAVKKGYESGVENILLSPGSSSFDAYTDYAERGRDFVAEVNKLA